MRIKLWGVRGSIPVAGPETEYYGGQTSCMDVCEEGYQLIFDGGSGIQKLELNNTKTPKRIDIFLTHLHMDHIQGLGFFRPLFDPGNEVHIWGPKSSTHTLHARLGRYLSPPLFPVLLRDLPCKLTFHEIERSQVEIGPFTITSNYIIHPGPTLAYRIEGKRSVLTYIPDHEPALGKNGIIDDVRWLSGFELARDTDLLLHDGQYSSEEYIMRKGWGHSSIVDAGKFAQMTNVKKVLFTHHDPYSTDNQLHKLFENFLNSNSYKYECEMAREGMVIDLD
ncbi:MAG: MBL fold metallo-hydrolase [Saprospiraceae bacterium]